MGFKSKSRNLLGRHINRIIFIVTFSCKSRSPHLHPLIFFLIYFQISDLIKIHHFICQNHEQQQPIVQLSLDGIMESKSSLVSLDTYCLKFEGCRNIYPIRIVRPCNRYKYDELKIVQEVLTEINENDLVIDCTVMDKPKRSMSKCLKSSAAKFPCEYCENAAVHCVVDINKKAASLILRNYELREESLSQQIENVRQTQDSEAEEIEDLQEEIDNLNAKKEAELSKTGRKHLTWPASTRTGNLRTLDKIRDIVNEIEENPEILRTDPDSCKGIKGKSPFLDQPNFHMIDDMPCEYMHCVCIGVGRRCVELTFRVEETRERKTKRKLSDPKLFNDLIILVQLPREFGRRCRALDFGVFKASEFRNIILFFFVIVLDCIEDEYKEEKKLWLHLAFMVRACVIPNCEFQKVKKKN